jgi:hypothetical protein
MSSVGESSVVPLPSDLVVVSSYSALREVAMFVQTARKSSETDAVIPNVNVSGVWGSLGKRWRKSIEKSRRPFI